MTANPNIRFGMASGLHPTAVAPAAGDGRSWRGMTRTGARVVRRMGTLCSAVAATFIDAPCPLETFAPPPLD